LHERARDEYSVPVRFDQGQRCTRPTIDRFRVVRVTSLIALALDEKTRKTVTSLTYLTNDDERASYANTSLPA
jgi:hypothetical protein